MPSIAGQRFFLRTQRIVKLLAYIFIVLLLITLIRWSSSSNHRTRSADGGNHLQLGKPVKYGRSDLAKYIHLDLKGAPPVAEKFYESFFMFLEKVQMGIKGVVIEYEDMLPLHGNLVNVTHRNSYTKSDMKLIEDMAKKHQMEIIPLIQTFGHLEWILKLRAFESYRDDPNLPMVISPCFNATYSLLEDLLQQTLDMHPNSNIIHIGCDEVALKNFNLQCQEGKLSVAETYINHIRRIADIVQKIRPGIRILIWDDILRGDEFIRSRRLLKQLEGLVEPVSWNYFPTFDNYYKTLPGWKIYPKYFKTIWAASAFKGGLHRFSIATNTAHHVLNNRQWLHFIESSTFRRDPFSAIILTGWSRFDHFMPLCDILPTSYPSLLYSLHVLNTDEYLVDHSIHDCAALLTSIGKDAHLCDLLPGLPIWSSISSLTVLLSTIRNRLKLLHTISPEYNRKHRFVRRCDLPSRLSELKNLSRDLFKNKQTINRHLNSLYSQDTIDEWLDLYITPIENQINTTFAEFASARDQLFWERRPLT